MRRAILGFIAGLTALALAASPAAAPARHAANAVTLKSAKLTSSWRESHFLSGRLVLTGTATAPMTLNVGWFAKSLLTQKKPSYGKGGPLTGHVSVKKGKFRKTIKFRTALYPGSFVLMGYAKGAPGVVSFPGRVLKMPAPPEGVVVKTTSHSTGRAGVFAKFVFAPNALPKSGTVQTQWFDPKGGGHTGTVRAAHIVNTNVKAPPALTVGFWRCQLRSGGRLIAEVSVRVG